MVTKKPIQLSRILLNRTDIGPQKLIQLPRVLLDRIDLVSKKLIQLLRVPLGHTDLAPQKLVQLPRVPHDRIGFALQLCEDNWGIFQMILLYLFCVLYIIMTIFIATKIS